MKYDNKRLGKELKKHLDQPFDIVNTSRWAYRIFSENIRYLDSPTEEILEYLFRMEDDPQFEYTKEELELLTEKLLNDEEDPLKQINAMKNAS
jgi:hypothetical protein